MANTAGVCNSFKTQVLAGQHIFGVDTFKMALYLASGSLGPTTTTAYSTASEVANSGSYVAGGQAVAMGPPALFTNTATVDPTPTSIQWTGFSATAFDTVLLYNNTTGKTNANAAVAVFNIGSQTIVSGTLTLTFPTPGAATSLLAFL